jgi:hypothetical protein
MTSRVYVGSDMVGLVESESIETIRQAAQRLSNAYPDEITVLKLGGNNKGEVIKPRPGAAKMVFLPEIERKPRLQRQPR